MGKFNNAPDAADPLAEPELPPLVYNPDWARPIKIRSGGFWDGHWIGFLFLLPFVVMFVLHDPALPQAAILEVDSSCVSPSGLHWSSCQKS